MKDDFCSLIMEGTEVFCGYQRRVLWKPAGILS